MNEGTSNSSATRRRESRLVKLRPFLDLVPAAILCVVALFEIVTIARAGHDTGSESEWARAAETVRERWQVGDLVVFAPRWIDPVGRQHMGELLTINDAARMDAARYTVVWEVSIRGARAAETRGRTLEEEISVGPISIRKWRGEPVVVLTDFRDALAKATKSGPGRPRVGLEEVGFEPHRCVVTVPAPDKTVEIAYTDVELGRVLVGYVGLGDVFTRRDIREPGKLELLIDGEPRLEVVVGVDDGWVRFETETTHRHADVTFRVTAVGPGARNRRICFAAEARQ